MQLPGLLERLLQDASLFSRHKEYGNSACLKYLPPISTSPSRELGTRVSGGRRSTSEGGGVGGMMGQPRGWNFWEEEGTQGCLVLRSLSSLWSVCLTSSKPEAQGWGGHGGSLLGKGNLGGRECLLPRSQRDLGLCYGPHAASCFP